MNNIRIFIISTMNSLQGKALISFSLLMSVLHIFGVINIGQIFPFLQGKEVGLIVILAFLFTSGLTSFDISSRASTNQVKSVVEDLAELQKEFAECKETLDKVLRNNFLLSEKHEATLKRLEVRELESSEKDVQIALLRSKNLDLMQIIINKK